MDNDTRKPCPNCGHCPTCGHSPQRVLPWYPNLDPPVTVPGYPNPWVQPYITCGGDTATTTTSTNLEVISC